MIDKDFVYSRIGMALISVQRVEFISGELVKYLSEFDNDLYKITTEEFLSSSKKAIKARMTLGKIFTLLKLNPKLVIEEELNEYLTKRNILVHGFWSHYLNTISAKQAKRAIDFYYDFGSQSDRVESFFKGFVFFLALRHVKDRTKVEFRNWEKDFDYFISSLQD